MTHCQPADGVPPVRSARGLALVAQVGWPAVRRATAARGRRPAPGPATLRRWPPDTSRAAGERSARSRRSRPVQPSPARRPKGPRPARNPPAPGRPGPDSGRPVGRRCRPGGRSRCGGCRRAGSPNTSARPFRFEQSSSRRSGRRDPLGPMTNDRPRGDVEAAPGPPGGRADRPRAAARPDRSTVPRSASVLRGAGGLTGRRGGQRVELRPARRRTTCARAISATSTTGTPLPPPVRSTVEPSPSRSGVVDQRRLPAAGTASKRRRRRETARPLDTDCEKPDG